MGWCGLLGADGRLWATHIGSSDPEEPLQGFRQLAERLWPEASLCRHDWHPALRERFIRYFEGSPETFTDVRVDLSWKSDFQQRVLELTRRIGYGRTTTYAELARRAGKPRAARAVGQVMAGNPLPLVIPCHRVVGCDGRLGGFSAPGGTVLKRRLLELEAAQPA